MKAHKRFKKLGVSMIFAGVAGVLALEMFPATAAAAENYSEVSNSISVSAASGGNSGGNISQGTASVEVKINQTVNGQELEPIIITTSSAAGESRSVEVHSSYATGSSAVTTDVSAYAGGDVKTNASPQSTTLEDATAIAAADSGAPASNQDNTLEHAAAQAPVQSITFFPRPVTQFLAAIKVHFNNLWGRFIKIF